MTTTTSTVETVEGYSEECLDYMKVSDLKFNPNNPRKTFDPAAIKELAASIEAEGQLQPMRVRADGTIIAGERRKRALDLLIKEKKLPADAEASCIILTGTTEAEDQMAALIENLQRVDLSPLEEARGYYSLLGLDVRQADIAKRVGRSSAHVSKRLSLLTLQEPVQQALEAGKITIEKALGLTAIADPKKQVALVDKDDWSIADALRKQQAKVATDKVKAELEGLGIEVSTKEMTRPPEGTDWQQVGDQIRYADFKGSAPKGVTSAVLSSYGGDNVVIRWYKLIDLPKGTVADDPKAAEAKAKVAQERAIAKQKAKEEALVAAVGAAASTPNKADVISLLIEVLLSFVNNQEEVGLALGIEPVVGTDYKGNEVPLWNEPVQAYAETNQMNALRVLLVNLAFDYDWSTKALALLGVDPAKVK